MSQSNESSRSSIRIVTRAADRRDKASPPRDAAFYASVETSTLYPHTYEVRSIPFGCTDFIVNDLIELYVTEPPAQFITLTGVGACDGTLVELYS